MIGRTNPHRTAKHGVGEVTKAEQPGDSSEREARPAGQGRTVRRVTTEDLLQGGNELIIAHRGDEYRLRVTSNGKLILNK